jgi:hypothetical protein
MINVYYSSVDSVFFEPEPLIKNLNALVKPGEEGSNVYSCPAFKSSIRNIFCIKAVNDYQLTWHPPSKEMPVGNITSTMYDKEYMDKYIHVRNLKEGFITYRDPPFVLFAEKSLEAEQLPAYYHNNKMGSQITITGKFDIGLHLRKFELAFNVRDKTQPTVFDIKTGDILFYVKFYTDEKINFIRFTHTRELEEMYIPLLSYRSRTKRILPLQWYYNYNLKYGLRKKYLEIIKKNILEKM